VNRKPYAARCGCVFAADGGIDTPCAIALATLATLAKSSPDPDPVQPIARVVELTTELNLTIAALWRIAGAPAGAVDLSMIEKAEARVSELERHLQALLAELEPPS
jgi:hypothetical protein